MKNHFLLLLLCLAALYACTNRPDELLNQEAGIQHAKQVSIFQSKDSQQQWILQADAVDFVGLNQAVLHAPRLLLRENGQDKARVSGQRGTFDYGKQLVSIEGHARVRALAEDALLTSEQFFYDVQKDHIWSDDKTVVTRADATITARNGIETDSKLNRIEFKQQHTRLPDNPSAFKEGLK